MSAILILALLQAQPAPPAPITATPLPPVTQDAAAPPADKIAPPNPAAGSISDQAPSPIPSPVEVLPDAPTITIRKHHAPGDPLEGLNRVSYKLSTAIDKVLWRPAAMTYRHVVPKPVRDGARNALSNIDEPLVFLNDLLQLKPGRALKTLARFVINSTLGLAGLIDTAKRPPFHLVHHDNSLGDTLGYYGIGPGLYLYLPVLGPTTLRDILAEPPQALLPARVIGSPFNRGAYQISTNIISGLDVRAESDDDLKRITADAVDPYATLRSVFLQDRIGEIAGLKHGGGTAIPDDLTTDPAHPVSAPSPLDDPLVDPAKPPASAPPAKSPQAPGEPVR